MRRKRWVGDTPEAELMMPRRPPMDPRMVTVMPYTRQKYDGMVWICKNCTCAKTQLHRRWIYLEQRYGVPVISKRGSGARERSHVNTSARNFPTHLHVRRTWRLRNSCGGCTEMGWHARARG